MLLVNRMTIFSVSRVRVERHVSPHMLRHPVATLLLRNSVDIRIVQQFRACVDRYYQQYTHVTKDYLIQVLREGHPSLAIRPRRERRGFVVEQVVVTTTERGRDQGDCKQPVGQRICVRCAIQTLIICKGETCAISKRLIRRFISRFERTL
jgi:hypothetical protein